MAHGKDFSYDLESSSGSSRRRQDDVVIAVMGSTGTGKSSFIKLLTGDNGIAIGHSLDSETSDVQIIRFLDRVSGRNVTIVDTPGFDDSRAGVTDTEILKTITNFLLEEYDNDRKLNGLIYVQRISDPRFGGQASRNLKMFRNLCGTETYRNVVVLTTFWDRVTNMREGVGREQQLKLKYFKELVEGGAHFMRHDRTIDSARKVLEHIFALVPTNMKIQEEIRVEGKSLEDTAAGSVHREEVERIIAKHRQEVAELKAEIVKMKDSNVALRRELEEERVRLRGHLERWENERSELKKGLDDVQQTRAQLESEAATERQNREKWRQEQESEWSSRFDSQAKAHDDALKKLYEQLVQEKEAREETYRKARDMKAGSSEKINESTGLVTVIDTPPPYEAVISAADTLGSRAGTYKFAHSDQYPPHLKVIPRKQQKNVVNIFNFTSLLETITMLSVGPALLPANLRTLAPNASSVRTMQDLEDRNYDLHTQARRQAGDRPTPSKRDMYFSKNIGLRHDWYTDAAFGQQQFTGTNPTTITQAPRRWVEEFTSAAGSQQRADVTELLGNGADSLFVQDYSDFRSAMKVSPTAELLSEGRYGCASVVLFRLEPEGKLHPLAVTIDYKGSIEESVTVFNRRLTSMALGDEATDWPWRYAKMCAQVSDWLRHEVAIHLVNTHLLEEVIIVAAHRTFEPSHMVFRLLEPHWTTTLPLNQAARSTLVPKIIIPMAGLTATQGYAFLKDAYSKFDWTGLYVPNDLRRRGFPIEDLDQRRYHNYAYARNIARMWEILRKFVSSVLTKVYVGGDAQVANDQFLTAFCQEVRSYEGGQLTSFPDIRTLDELIDFATMCIHIASPQHTAINYLQQYYQTFIPNKPAALYSRLPQTLAELESIREEDVLAALPLKRSRDWLVMAQVPYLLSFEVPDESTILHYASTTSDSRSTPEIIRNAARELRDDLEDFILTVSENSRQLDDQDTPYLVMDPSKTAISIIL